MYRIASISSWLKFPGGNVDTLTDEPCPRSLFSGEPPEGVGVMLLLDMQPPMTTAPIIKATIIKPPILIFHHLSGEL
ncbi:hypothetical protein PNA2_0559 [Pyrococcus sp. NA2]|nr:hypothetical protein PNA2_0559 [Pyrococcus sp. NA2]